jgi:hypothetical protein
MKKLILMAILLIPMILVANLALADELYIFPNKGQSKDQMEKDKFDCYKWAKENSGFDPMEQPKATAPPPQKQPKKGGVLRGAAAGAAVGGIIDGGDGAGKGAAVGALAGAVRRRNQTSQEAQSQKQWEQEQSANYQNNREKYNRAYSACLEGKGYTVK